MIDIEPIQLAELREIQKKFSQISNKFSKDLEAYYILRPDLIRLLGKERTSELTNLKIDLMEIYDDTATNIEKLIQKYGEK